MKRFTETTKWDDPWFIRLSSVHKLLWIYLCDRCDASGVIDFVPELASVQIGSEVSEQHLTELGNRLEKLPSGKWRILKFLPFQYGTVDAKCPAHKPVIKLIEANGITYPINNVLIPYSNRVLNKDKEKDKEKDSYARAHARETPHQTTKYGYPLPPRCTINKFGDVLDYTGRTMDINQVRNALAAAGIATNASPLSSSPTAANG